MNESAPQGEPVYDNWRSACQAAISHLDYESGAPSTVKEALRALRDAFLSAGGYAATPPAPPQGLPAPLPVAWRHRLTWADGSGVPSMWTYTEDPHTPGDAGSSKNDPLIVKEVQALYAGLTLPAVVQVEPSDEMILQMFSHMGPRSKDGLFRRITETRAIDFARAVLRHQAAPSSPKAQAPAPFSEPRSIGQGELPVRAEMEPRCPRCKLPQSECDFQRNFPDPEVF